MDERVQVVGHRGIQTGVLKVHDNIVFQSEC